MATEEMNVFNSVEEATEAIEEVVTDCEELEALDGVEKTSDKLLRKCAEAKDACVDLAKKGFDASKTGVTVAKDVCVDLAKKGFDASKTGVTVAKDVCVDLAKKGFDATKTGVTVAKDVCVDLAKKGFGASKTGVTVAKDACVGAAKKGFGASKTGVTVAKDACVGAAKKSAGVAKKGVASAKNGVLTAKTACVEKTKAVKEKMQEMDYNPHFKQTRVYKLEMFRKAGDTEPVDTVELTDEKEFSLVSLAAATGAVIALSVTAGILAAKLLDD